MKIQLSPRAVREAARCAKWWREQRPAAADLFEEELREALTHLREMPEAGVAYSATPTLEHRRLLMPRTRFHLYYRFERPETVQVVAVWSALRGRGPRL